MNILGFLSILGKLLYFQLDEICRNVTSFLKVIELLMIHAVEWELTWILFGHFYIVSFLLQSWSVLQLQNHEVVCSKSSSCAQIFSKQ